MSARSWPRRLNASLALVCIILSLCVAWVWLQAPQVPEAPRSASAAARNSLRPWQWFATNTDTLSRIEANTEALEEARLDAKLLGVVYTLDKATATLRVGGRTEKVYRAGDEIQGGLQIAAIEPYRVVVVQNGKREQISMARGELPMLGNTASNPPAESPPPGFSLGEVFTAVPVSLDGQNSGLKLDSLSAEIQQLVELQEGDVIVRVGNHSIQELLQNPVQWMQYSTNGALPVTILRDGQESVIHVNGPAMALRFLPALGRGN